MLRDYGAQEDTVTYTNSQTAQHPDNKTIKSTPLFKESV